MIERGWADVFFDLRPKGGVGEGVGREVGRGVGRGGIISQSTKIDVR